MYTCVVKTNTRNSFPFCFSSRTGNEIGNENNIWFVPTDLLWLIISTNPVHSYSLSHMQFSDGIWLTLKLQCLTSCAKRGIAGQFSHPWGLFIRVFRVFRIGQLWIKNAFKTKQWKLIRLPKSTGWWKV